MLHRNAIFQTKQSRNSRQRNKSSLDEERANIKQNCTNWSTQPSSRLLPQYRTKCNTNSWLQSGGRRWRLKEKSGKLVEATFKETLKSLQCGDRSIIMEVLSALLANLPHHRKISNTVYVKSVLLGTSVEYGIINKNRTQVTTLSP